MRGRQLLVLRGRLLRHLRLGVGLLSRCKAWAREMLRLEGRLVKRSSGALRLEQVLQGLGLCGGSDSSSDLRLLSRAAVLLCR